MVSHLVVVETATSRNQDYDFRKTKRTATALICFDLRVFDVSREEGVSVWRGRGGVPGQRGHRHPHRHSLHHLLCPLPGVWVPPQVSPASSRLFT